MVRTLILDADQRASLATARALHRRGLAVDVASTVDRPLSGSSSATRSVVRYPSPETSVRAFQSWVRAQTDSHVLPITDLTSPFVFEGEDLAAYVAISNKASLVESAMRCGVPVPHSEVIDHLAHLRRPAVPDGQPRVLKPAQSRVVIGDRVVKTSVVISRSDDQATRVLTEAEWFPTAPVIVQEFIPGHGAGVFCLYDRDHAVAWFAHRRIREKPPSGGVSVLCESVPVDPVLKDYAERLLRAASYRGVAMVEFRIGTDGKPYLMEVNARFWGSLQLAIDCGVDFPWLYYQMLMGERVEPVTQYQVGRRLRWFLGDVDNLLLQMRDRERPWTAKAAAVGRFIGTGFDPRCRQEVFRWSDPGPGLLELRQWVGGVLGRS